jgi:hypothetical protein
MLVSHKEFVGLPDKERPGRLGPGRALSSRLRVRLRAWYGEGRRQKDARAQSAPAFGRFRSFFLERGSGIVPGVNSQGDSLSGKDPWLLAMAISMKLCSLERR